MTPAIHAFYLLLSLTGMPESVVAVARTSASHQMECEDTVAAVFQYANGAIGNVDATTAAYPSSAERTALSFTHGSATLESGELRVEWMHGKTFKAGSKQSSGSGAKRHGLQPRSASGCATGLCACDRDRCRTQGQRPLSIGRASIDRCNDGIVF